MPKTLDASSKEPQKAKWRNTPLGNIIVLGVAVVAVLALLWVVRGGGATTGGEAPTAASGESSITPLADADTEGSAPEIGEVAPEFSARTIDGEDIAFPPAGGKPAWIVFNATWCSNCRAETPDVEEAFREYGEDVEIISVYVSDTLGAVKAYSDQLELTFPQILDEGDIAAKYRVLGLPTHYFVDENGEVEGIDVGTLSLTQLRERIETISRN